MGCDIHSAVEIRRDGQWHWDASAKFNDILDHPTNEPFDWRNYGMFGFLADVRNYSHVPPLSESRGLPYNLSPELTSQDGGVTWLGDHSFSWLSLSELLDFDYDRPFEDRRITTVGGGSMTTFREFLGQSFFNELEILKTYGSPEDIRIVFGFDS